MKPGQQHQPECHLIFCKRSIASVCYLKYIIQMAKMRPPIYSEMPKNQFFLEDKHSKRLSFRDGTTWAAWGEGAPQNFTEPPSKLAFLKIARHCQHNFQESFGEF